MSQMHLKLKAFTTEFMLVSPAPPSIKVIIFQGPCSGNGIIIHPAMPPETLTFTFSLYHPTQHQALSILPLKHVFKNTPLSGRAVGGRAQNG